MSFFNKLSKNKLIKYRDGTGVKSELLVINFQKPVRKDHKACTNSRCEELGEGVDIDYTLRGDGINGLDLFDREANSES